MKLDGLLMTNYVFQNNLGPGQAAQWLAHHPIQQKVVGSIPHWGMYGRQLIDVSLLLSFLLSSLSEINKHILKRGLKKFF